MEASPRHQFRRLCETCGRQFSKKEHYDRHVRTHTRERPFACGHCPARFSRRDSLLRHIRSSHPGLDTRSSTSDGTVVVVSAPQEEISSVNAGEQASTGTEVVSTSDICDVPSTHQVPRDIAEWNVDAAAFNWQWDGTFDLDASFNFDDFGTYDVNHANPGTPWLPLQPFVDSITRTSPRRNSPSTVPTYSSTNSSSTFQTGTVPLDVSASSAAGEDISRVALANSLQQRVPDTSLPATQFLNRCLHIFTTQLWPLLPIIHLPTFRPSQTNPLLLLSICSLGALADGSKESLYHAERLYIGVQKAILISWDMSHTQDHNMLALIQAGVIGQTYAILSAQPANLLAAHAFHGALWVAACRFNDQIPAPNTPPASEKSHPLLSRQWHDWCQAQTITRVLNAIYVQNHQVAAIVQQSATLRTNPLNTTMAAPDNVFLAKTAEAWAELQLCSSASHQGEMGQDAPMPSMPHSAFSSCATLSCFATEIGHAKADPFEDMQSGKVGRFQQSLIEWLEKSADLVKSESSQRLSVQMLWHSCFLQLFCDMHTLDMFCSRGKIQDDTVFPQPLRVWMETGNASRCVVHALSISKLLACLRVGNSPAIHVSRCLWQAGLVMATYSFLVQKSDVTHDAIDMDLYPELRALQSAGLFSDHERAIVLADATGERCRAVAFSLSATLRYLGPWQSAGQHAVSLDRILKGLESC